MTKTIQLKPPISDENFVYVLEVSGSEYHVYHFHKQGKPGTLAFRYHHPRRRFEIAVMCGGHLPREQTLAMIREGLAETLN